MIVKFIKDQIQNKRDQIIWNVTIYVHDIITTLIIIDDDCKIHSRVKFKIEETK